MADVNLDLAPIGNCTVSALVDRLGRYIWACVPRVDGDPVFCGLLGGRDPSAPDATGVWSIELEDLASAEQTYLRNTPVLSTRLTDRQGAVLEILDFCPRFKRLGRTYRPIAFARLVRPVSGAPRIRMKLRPMVDWGRRPAERTWGSNHVRYVGDRGALRLTTNAPVSHVIDERVFRVEGELAFFLGPDESFSEDVGQRTRQMVDETVGYWRDWVRTLSVPLEWQQVVIRAAITLKLCAFEETGAIVAALTTSVPEAPHSGRNWDYRFCWIRDAYYVVVALNRLGVADMLENYLGYLRNLVDNARGGHIQPLYGVGLEPVLSERIIENLPGYRGMGPIRAGNQAHEHLQHDVYGQIVLSNVQAFFDQRLLRMADVEDFKALEKVGERAWQLHASPDAGLWEFRTRAAVHTYSSAMCWAACDRLCNAAGALGLSERQAFWRDRADQIRARIEREAFNPQLGRYAATFGGVDDIDASLLQLAELRFVQADDPRFKATLDAVEHGLRRGSHMLRYAVPDDFGMPETAFNFCTFWLIEALQRVGRTQEARDLFNETLKTLTHSGLLSEDTDLKTGELWGNFPQTYSLVGLINCAVLLSQPWSSVR
ncbi:glycoside hydrolase family 15 protein [Caulobacter sp. 17J65-9]|uniref:glycoside hydrolase family 15 protein n=1 Tax=Caulobacter sp. 17J65-9 TaxID=2709382 RepID=UPI0013CA4CBE|nr:glycoside hydrolase family 15 protein [Caulobacter sp. 17J65-9]NEX93925.1 glycoside hydrolase family 15 protein [Caulobacter sp. 17J65-9]